MIRKIGNEREADRPEDCRLTDILTRSSYHWTETPRKKKIMQNKGETDKKKQLDKTIEG